MYARVISGDLRPGKSEEAVRIWNEELPRYRDVAGFLGGQLLIDGKESMVSITLWDTEIYSQDHVDSGAMTRALSRFLELMTEDPSIHGYDVAAQI